jgi:predicted amidohydrolase
LNCHDYTNINLIKLLLDEKLDFIIVSAFNPATRLFTEYALSDVHRLFGFVIISNIANYGGSGIYGPFRRKGKKHGISLSGTLCQASGEGSAYLEYDLPLADLKEYRNYFYLSNGRLKAREPDSKFVSVLPPEYFLSGNPEYHEWINKPNFIQYVDLGDNEIEYMPELDKGNAIIAIAHLKSIDQEAYLNNYYNFSKSELMPGFANKLNLELNLFFEKVLYLGIRPNFIIFPEVFLPLSSEEILSKKALELNSIIIGGFEYDPQTHLPSTPEEAIGSNRCFILVPNNIKHEIKKYEYKKVTFSKYDAMIDENRWFKLEKGDHVIRFHHKDFGSFGVLICYDYSHFDIVYSINSFKNRFSPLDILFIVSQNPDSSLYRHCCIADSHRFYQYIVMCNTSQYGGSGVFGPIKKRKERYGEANLRQTLAYADKGIEGISLVTLDLCGLRRAKKMQDELIDAFPYEPYRFMKKPGAFQEGY